MKVPPLAAVAAAALFVCPALSARPRPLPGTAAAVPGSGVVHPAPEFAWSSVTGKVRRLRDLRGHPVILIFATGPTAKDFNKQVREITRRYQQLATRNAL